MRIETEHYRPLLLATVAALLLGACGGTEQQTEPVPPSEPVAEATPEPEPTPAPAP